MTQDKPNRLRDYIGLVQVWKLLNLLSQNQTIVDSLSPQKPPHLFASKK